VKTILKIILEMFLWMTKIRDLGSRECGNSMVCVLSASSLPVKKLNQLPSADNIVASSRRQAL